MNTLLLTSHFARVGHTRLSWTIAALVASSAPSFAQLDLQSWTLVDPYNRWSQSNPTATSCRMDETASSSTVGPGWVISPFVLPENASFSISMQPLANGDDDLIGIAFSYQSNTQHLLLDWKKSTQSFNWGDPVGVNDDLAEAGMKVKKINGSWTRDGLWGGTDGLGVSTLSGPLAPGWANNAVYDFEFDITPGHAIIRRGGVQIFDIVDPAVTAGRIGFYSLSQDDLIFSNVHIDPDGPLVYCTAGTSSGGCVPSINATGTPDISASSGYTLSIAGVPGQKQGLLFYGISGQAISPWGAGGTSFLCVKAPTQRMLAQNSGGTSNACDGSLDQDWLAFIATNPTALGTPLVAGQQINAQGWYRDPAAVKTTNLSDALEFVLQP